MYLIKLGLLVRNDNQSTIEELADCRHISPALEHFMKFVENPESMRTRIKKKGKRNRWEGLIDFLNKFYFIFNFL